MDSLLEQETEEKTAEEIFREKFTGNLDKLADGVIKVTPKGSLDTRFVRRKVLFDNLKIRTKEQTLIPFRLNSIQAAYNRLMGLGAGHDLDIYKLRGMRELDLKFRQPGMSTYIMGLYFIQTIMIPHTRTVIMAHIQSSTETLFQAIHRFYKHLPDDLKPFAKLASKREMYFPDIDSGIYVGTAGSDDFGVGTTTNNLHCSEVALWKNPDSILKGVFQSVPINGNIFMESTARGVGNYFHQQWLAALNKKSIFKPRFFAWQDFPEYKIELDEIARNPQFEVLRGFSEKTLTNEEKELIEKFDLTMAQIAWRRWKIMELGELFPQEYPMTWEEAFRASGKTYFSKSLLSSLDYQLSSRSIGYDTFNEEWETSPNADKYGYDWLKKASAEGRVKIYKTPEVGKSYLIPADVAHGLDKDEKHDYSCCDVLDLDTWEQVAHVHGQWDAWEWSQMLVALGWWYNTGWIAPERNDNGGAVIQHIYYHTNYPVDGKGYGLYKHEDDKFGWPTNVRTRPIMLQSLSELLEDGSIKLNNVDTLSEMMSFILLPNNKAGAEAGCHDDRVLSLAIGAAILYTRNRKVLKPVAGGPVKFYTGDQLREFAPSHLPGQHLPEQRLFSPPKILLPTVKKSTSRGGFCA